MPTTIDCPTCGRKLLLPDALAASSVKCPTCAATFSSASSATPAALRDAERVIARSEVPALEPQLAGPSLSRDVRTCPYCRESIPVSATLCRYCGEESRRADDDVPPWEQEGAMRRDVESHRSGLILALAIAGMIASGIHVFSIIGVPLSITAWVMAQRDLGRMRANELDPSGTGLAQSARICAIIGASMGVMWWILGLVFLFTKW